MSRFNFFTKEEREAMSDGLKSEADLEEEEFEYRRKVARELLEEEERHTGHVELIGHIGAVLTTELEREHVHINSLIASKIAIKVVESLQRPAS